MLRVVTNDLWKFNFVHRWGLPEGVAEGHIALKKKYLSNRYTVNQKISKNSFRR